MTPEGEVKARVKKVLAKFGDEINAFWPVQNGMGSPTLDCVVCCQGRYIAIETKAPGKLPTPRQLITISKMEKAGAKVFVIDGEIGCEALAVWLYDRLLFRSRDAEPERNQIHSRF